MVINGFGSFTYVNPYRLAFIREANILLAKHLERSGFGESLSSTPTAETRDQLVKIRRQVVELRNALETINRPEKLSRTFSFGSAPVAATATSSINLNLGTIPLTAATLESTEEVNTTATSFTPFGPDFTGTFSTALTTIGGTYDGSNGTGTLTFRADKGGTHGSNDIKLKVYDPGDNFIEDILIDKENPINQVYTLSNGLTLTLGAGDAVKNDNFTLDVDAGAPPTFTPTNPIWNGSDAEGTIGGVYDGSNGSGTLTFRVDRDGLHGVKDIKLKVYDPGDNFIEDILIDKENPINQVYTLSNGLTFTLSAGALKDG